jgi:glycine dehydrogenase subunit 1
MRYLPLTDKNRQEMLAKIGVASVDDLFIDVPETARLKAPVDLPPAKSELQVERFMVNCANQNRPAGEGPFFLGAGLYNHHIPATVDYIIQRSEFLTAYTPYQPEIAQGTLQVIFEYQSMIALLTGQDVANASMYDGATSCAEAVLMAMRLTGRKKIKIATPLNPDYEDVLNSYLWNYGDAQLDHDIHPDDQTACILVQSPDFFGTPHDLNDMRQKCDQTGAKLIVVISEILSLGLLPAPHQADIVCGEAQSLGLPMSYGGPHLGFFACRQDYIRQMPGRLCGQTTDVDGKPSFVLTLNTREQHIRRDKATSNICTNQGLCALAFTTHLSLLGEEGFKHLAKINHERASLLSQKLSAVQGVTIENKFFFNEFVIRLSKDARKTAQSLLEDQIIAGLPLDGNRLLVCATEMTSDEDMDIFVHYLNRELNGEQA